MPEIMAAEKVNIDPDALARRINSMEPEKARVSAGKEAIRLARDCINHQRDFSIETTLSGGNATRLMQTATSVQNLLKHLDLIHYLLVIDNSSLDGEFVLEAENGWIKYQSSGIPDWVLPIQNQLQKN
ncbi:hypothetical protein [Paenibacillus arenilitoris]|uniref:hypothetical protein n=1 Tax=Paenibacillus arenilitoris TaxID=2772299 RepID=UPI001CC22895|nr:hypothetical protein [Paenibacillus arenilitoris]